MKITLRCLPGYEDYLPKPFLARGALPDWLKAMPAGVFSAILGGDIRTVKQCPPFIDAMQNGIMFPLAADLSCNSGVLSWDWDLPRHGSARQTRAPVGVHVPEQAGGAPLRLGEGQFVVKFNNYWTVELPKGWSMLFGHPVNRADLPFRTLTGLVDCDRWNAGFVHFPAIWRDTAFEGTLPAGMPVAQAFAVRREQLELAFEAMDEAMLDRHLALQDELQQAPGVYRKSYRAGPSNSSA